MRNKFQRDMANKLHEDGLNFNEISVSMGISRHVVRHLCQYKYKTTSRKAGPKHKIEPKEKIRIKRQISQFNDNGEKVNSRKLKDSCQLNVSTRTIQRYLKNCGLKYKKATSKILLTMKHRDERQRIISNWICNNHNWETTIFSDEKRFSFDGPDDWRTYVGKSEKYIRQKRQCKGGGIMVWLMVLPNGLLCHRVIKGKFKANDYLSLLKDLIVPIIFLNYGTDFYFQQDNASVHKAKSINEFIDKSNIKVIEWPAKSPDINISEDVWNIISRDVYDGRQFNTNEELINKVTSVINNINMFRRNEIINLYGQIRPRLCKILKSGGNIYNL